MNPDERAAAVKRLTFLVAAVLLWAAAIFFKLVSMQVLQHQRYTILARKQQEHVIPVQAPRGYIYDRTGRPLAISVPVDSVFVNPLRLPDLAAAAELMAPILDLDEKKLEKDFREAVEDHRGFVWVKRKISSEESRRLHELKQEWIEFQTESVREYPDGEVAAHLLGGVYKDEVGVAGIEKSLDDVLKGKPGKEDIVVDVHKRVLDSQTETQAQPGESITMTIDARIQFVAERAIREAVSEKYHCRSGTVIVMNPNTGDIYALANYPTYNPGEPPKPGEDRLARMDLGVQVPFEPGSIFKIMTVSAALDTNTVTPDTPINCMGGVLHLPGRVIHDSHAGLGIISVKQVIEHSSNIGAIQIGTKVGREKMYDYVRRFGFGAPTGIPLPAESGGKFRKLERWGTTSLASVSMGQEVSATSLQLARACSVIANGGYLIQPRLILRRGDTVVPPAPGKRIIKPETAMTVRNIMEGVVLEGTGRGTVKVPGYSVAGKTGTAQIFDFATKHYTHTYNASFMGFMPVKDPQLVVIVTLNGTTGNWGFGASAAGPVFDIVSAEALRILDVPKDLPDEPEKNAKPEKPDPKEINDLAISDLDPSQPNIMEDDDSTPAVVAGNDQSGPRVPNFMGKTMRQVMELASSDGIPVVVAGSGIVRDQMPLAGEVLLPGQKVKVKFAR